MRYYVVRGMRKPSYYLIDAVEHQKRFSCTFELPPEHYRKTISPGELVKLMFIFPIGDDAKVERMWVRVISVTEGGYEGQLENEPDNKGFISKGDTMMFEAKHIINIYPPRVYLEDLTLRDSDSEN